MGTSRTTSFGVLLACLQFQAIFVSLLLSDISGASTPFIGPFGPTFWRALSRFLSPVSSAPLPSLEACEEHFSNGTGSFTSPGHPNWYSGRKGDCQDVAGSCTRCSSQCVWTVTLPEVDSVVRLTFDDLQYNNSLLCCADYVEVRDGSSSSSPLLTSFCNSSRPQSVLSTGRSIYVRLVSATDEAVFGLNSVRFKASWSTACHKILTDLTGVVQSPGFPAPYEADFECTYLIKQDRGYRVSLTFTSFSLDPMTNRVCGDYLTVYDGSSEQSAVLGGPYCGTALPGQLTSTSNTLLLKFHSDSQQRAPNTTGFQLNYTSTTLECSTLTLTEENGEIRSPGFPDPFPKEGECVWHIIAPDWNHVIDFTLNEVNLGPDTNVHLDCDSEGVTSELAVYDGPFIDPGALLARYCRRNVFSHGITSTKDEMTIVFRTKNLKEDTTWNQTLRHGFSASYQARVGDEFTVTSDRFVPALLYGDAAEDKHLDKNKGVFNLKLDSSIAIGNERIHVIHIYRDGKVSFSKGTGDTAGNQKPCQQRKRSSVCAYCATIDTSTKTESAVHYGVHHRNGKYDAEVVAPVEQLVRQFKGQDDFNASLVVVVTWDRVLSTTQSGNATFQIAIAASELETYAVVIYKHNSMRWKPVITTDQPIIDAGHTIYRDGKPQCRDLIFSRTSKIFDIDRQLGNLEKEGTWVYELGRTPHRNTALACDAWYAKNSGELLWRRKTEFDRLPKCPCTRMQTRISLGYYKWRYITDRHVYTVPIESTGAWVPSRTIEDAAGSVLSRCYRLSKSTGRAHFPYGKECCYTKDETQLLQDQPDAGTATAFNPSFEQLVMNYRREDKLAYEDCCVTSNSTLHCSKFYILRPVGQCQPVPTITTTWSWGDPHIITLDEGEYTFNGWGEYTMMTMKPSRGLSFTLQARTSLAQTEDGQLVNATVFSAYGAEENGVRMFVGLDPDTNTTFVIYADGKDLSKSFRMNPSFLLDTQHFLIRRIDDRVSILFTSGINLVVGIRQKSLAASVSVPQKYRNKTSGLLGNYNGIKTDDFILPNGTSLGQNLTEQEIFYTFGPAWAVRADNSVMWYGPEEGPETYSHPDFLPVFLNEAPPDVREAAVNLCGESNMACIYDYVATGNESFALDSKAVKDTADLTNEALKNAVPQLDVIPTVFVISGETTTFTLAGQDPDGETLTYHAEFNDTNGTVLLDSNTGVVTYTPDMNTSVSLRFFAMDSKQAVSPSRVATVVVCSGCNGHGECDNTSPTAPLDGVQSFQHAPCVCNPGWTGDNCESEEDGCAEDPCLPGQTCRDLSPEEQGSSIKGFDCGPCPKGYAYYPGYIDCMDVNECRDSALNDCQMNCSNNDGSYLCSCRAGYRLNSDGRTCRDVDECREKTARCQQLCHNTDGGYQCGCQDGYVLDETGRGCQPHPVVAARCERAGCSQGCKINASSGSPECFCFAGYEVDPSRPTGCVDRDECQDNICSQQCFNFDGGFSCLCHSGYSLAEDRVTCSPCKDLTYGPNCQFHCRCGGHAEACHHVTGCVCGQGWRGAQCREDTDECTENPNVCGTDRVCLNTPGSYSCRCLDGYVKTENGSCTDIDECSESSLLNTCITKNVRRGRDSLYRCVNVPGSFHCTCLEGYATSGDTCLDIDECALGVSDCEQKCTNVPGSYNCDCFYGFRLNANRTACVAVADVCAEEEGLNCEHGCTMSGGTAVCFCRVGYTLNPDRHTCYRELTCSNANCSHLCTDVDDKPVCSCPDGMVLDNNKKTCEDCLAGTYGKDCTNKCDCGLGASHCDVISGCVCKSGWTGEKCGTDVNECTNTSIVKECEAKQAECFNTPGSYRCQCSAGFAFNNDTCQDIDECREAPCEQQCENSAGSYRCLCSHGFTLNHTTGECTDLDECAMSAANPCRQGCVNVAGSYLCVCHRAGFSLHQDGVSCVETEGCTRTDCPTENGGCSEEQCFCDSGYQLSDNNTCNIIDVDWCAEAGCDQECQETSDGSSFLCSCGDGYLLNDDRRTCRECPAGFYGKNCANQCSCGSGAARCDVTLGCVCPEGWTGPQCDSDVNECNVTSGMEQCEKIMGVCVNTPGSYVCQCPEGSSLNTSGVCQVSESPSSVCGGLWTSPTGGFQSPNFPDQYSNRLDCVYVIRVPEGQFIRLHFHTFDLESFVDYLEIRDGGTETSRTFGQFSGTKQPFSLNTSGNQMWLKLHTDNSIVKSGFNATYTTERPLQCGGTWMALSGTLQSPGFPDRYPDDLNCVYVITTREGYYVTLNFTALDLQGDRDFVEIRDGGSEGSPRLGRFSTLSLPHPLRSRGNQMWIKLVSDGSVARSGFSANYISGSCGGLWTAVNGTIQSPNFPNNYPNRQDCVDIVIAPVGQRVTLTFTAFDVEPTYDYVEVRDGGSKASPLIRKFSRMTTPLSVRTFGNQLWVNFVSDFSIARTGFRAYYTSG